MKTYTARATRWEMGWEISIDGEHAEVQALATQSHGTADAYPRVADLISLWTGEPEDSFAVEVTFRFEPGQLTPMWNGRRTWWLPTWLPRFQRLR